MRIGDRLLLVIFQQSQQEHPLYVAMPLRAGCNECPGADDKPHTTLGPEQKDNEDVA
jgi:hypothetical protein